MSIATTHENYAHTWWTPPEWMEWVEESLGCKPFDPCPTDWSLDDCWDGTMNRWQDNWYCNHPGSRNSTKTWWSKAASEIARGNTRGIWCAFNDEQQRHMTPTPWEMNGYMIMPRERLGFIWGGPDIIVNEKAVAKGAEPKWRRHGDRCKSPGNWTVFWSSVVPAKPPAECVIVRTLGPGFHPEFSSFA